METFVTRKGILRPAGAEDKRESGANPGQFPLLYALYAAGESSSHCPAGDGKAACKDKQKIAKTNPRMQNWQRQNRTSAGFFVSLLQLPCK